MNGKTTECAFLSECRNVSQRLIEVEIQCARNTEVDKAIIGRLDYNNGKIDQIDVRTIDISNTMNDKFSELEKTYYSRPSWTVSAFISALIALLAAIVGYLL